MRRLMLGSVALALMCTNAPAQDRKGMRLWNLTSATVVEFRLSPVGKTDWGRNQCENDRDKTVSHDERLRITGLEPGRYDAKVGYGGGRICFVSNLELKSDGVFTVEDKDLKDCNK
jgi:hypothetical protein